MAQIQEQRTVDPNILFGCFFVCGVISVLGIKFKWFRARIRFNHHQPSNPTINSGVYRQTFDPEMFTMNTDAYVEPKRLSFPSNHESSAETATIHDFQFVNKIVSTNPLPPPLPTTPVPTVKEEYEYLPLAHDYLPIAQSPKINKKEVTKIKQAKKNSTTKHPTKKLTPSNSDSNPLDEFWIPPEEERLSHSSNAAINAKVDLWINDSVKTFQYQNDDDAVFDTKPISEKKNEPGHASVKINNDTTQYSSTAASIFLRKAEPNSNRPNFKKNIAPPLPKTAPPPYNVTARNINMGDPDEASLSSQTSA